MQRMFDIIIATLGLTILLIPLLILSIIIKLDSSGAVIFKQKRVGLNGVIFFIFKFRTMYAENKKGISLTIGSRDKRITRVGYYLRKYKLDELPQLFNVLRGQMSLVGPRPEVPEYVQYYSENEKELLTIRPGITDEASIKYINENDILAKSRNPFDDYVNIIMKEKLRINRQYFLNYNLKSYFRTIFRTFLHLIK